MRVKKDIPLYYILQNAGTDLKVCPCILRTIFLTVFLLIMTHSAEGGQEGIAGSESSSQDEIVLIPEGEFIMGSNAPADGKPGEEYGVDEEPRHNVYLNAYYIDRFEVSRGEFREFVKATGREWLGDSYISEEYPAGGSLYTPQDQHPVNYVSWVDAEAFCKWKGKRLPTEAEWEKAARGTDGRRWPWGDEFDSKKANVEEFRKGHPEPVGSHPDDKSLYGLYDMSGNVSEWTSSYYLSYPGNKYDDGRYTKDARMLKGGSFLLPGRLYGRGAARSLAFPAYHHRMYGFRCAKDA